MPGDSRNCAQITPRSNLAALTHGKRTQQISVKSQQRFAGLADGGESAAVPPGVCGAARWARDSESGYPAQLKALPRGTIS